MLEAEQHFCDARLQCNHRRLIDIAPGKVASADDVVHFVAKNSIAKMLRQQISDELNREFNRRECEGKMNDRLPGFSHWLFEFSSALRVT